MIVRCEITKGEAVRYLSHLDYAGAIERALRRSKLPLAYSEGFNPHMRMAFASALAVGVTSQAEYMDVTMTQEIPMSQVRERLVPQLPPGISLQELRQITPQHKSLMALVNGATYRITAHRRGGSGDPALSLERFNRESSVDYTRVTPKGRRDINLKEFLPEPVRFLETGSDIIMEMAIAVTPAGSVKPGEVLEVLAERYDLSVDPAGAAIHRLGLWVHEAGSYVSPMKI
ncbi:TIGR03936 family radical SAM-associated protein [Acetonema longum]|uniref:DUF2344 domain-containing protein n=1 Tax=Acetonema longum DSM 6540 TaxID=1009370 RepID=F7NHP8_9FIRM|nr:TIGR03936 family radical SAM-associated protein [Acetonema longum]EGO64423.1 hypothetical protein ALO_07978 [Acetonema longum DSM 6540]